MPRATFIEKTATTSVDCLAEYQRLYSLAATHSPNLGFPRSQSFLEFVNDYFCYYDHRGTCVSLNDFNREYGFDFPRKAKSCNLDTLVSYAEYVFNLVSGLEGHITGSPEAGFAIIKRHVENLTDQLGLEKTCLHGKVAFVETPSGLVTAASYLPDTLRNDALAYRHGSMQGDIESKRILLMRLGKHLEPRQGDLEHIDKDLKSDIFFLLNELHIRHDNISPESGGHYHETIAAMNESELEQWYDMTYELIMLAVLALGGQKHHARVAQLKKSLKAK